MGSPLPLRVARQHSGSPVVASPVPTLGTPMQWVEYEIPMNDSSWLINRGDPVESTNTADTSWTFVDGKAVFNDTTGNIYNNGIWTVAPPLLFGASMAWSIDIEYTRMDNGFFDLYFGFYQDTTPLVPGIEWEGPFDPSPPFNSLTPTGGNPVGNSEAFYYVSSYGSGGTNSGYSYYLINPDWALNTKYTWSAVHGFTSQFYQNGQFMFGMDGGSGLGDGTSDGVNFFGEFFSFFLWPYQTNCTIEFSNLKIWVTQPPWES